jgi:hypothetical protein
MDKTTTSKPARKASRRKASRETPPVPAPPRKFIVNVDAENDELEPLGIHAGDRWDAEETPPCDLRAGDLVAVLDIKQKKWTGFGRFVSFDGEEFRVCESDASECRYTRGEGLWTIYLLTAITRRTPVERGTTEDVERHRRDAEAAKLYARLDRLTSCEDESERFRVLRRIFDLESAPLVPDASDEWAEVICAE